MGPILAGDFGSGFSVRQYALDGTSLFWTQTFPSINFALPAAIDRGVVLSGFSTGPTLPLLHNLHVCGQVLNPGSLSNSLMVRIDQTGVTVQSTWLGSSYIGPLVQVDGGWSALGSISGNPSAYAPNAYVQVLSVGPSASAQPMPIGCMADVAQGTKSTASPGMLVNLNIETSAESFVTHPDSAGHFPTSLEGMSVTFDNAPMPLFALSGQKLTGAVPFSVAGKSSSQMCLGVACTKVAVAPVAPSIFATVVNQDGTVNSVTHPAAAGSIVTFYLTGLGSLSPPVADGSIVTSLVPQLVTPVSVQFTSSYVPPGFPAVLPAAPPVAAEVIYAGPAPFEVAGVYQINVRIPAGVLGSATIIAGSASAIANVSLSN
jgi:uncharacterized protein (TIGR03437 family)